MTELQGELLACVEHEQGLAEREQGLAASLVESSAKVLMLEEEGARYKDKLKNYAVQEQSQAELRDSANREIDALTGELQDAEDKLRSREEAASTDMTTRLLAEFTHARDRLEATNLEVVLEKI